MRGRLLNNKTQSTVIVLIAFLFCRGSRLFHDPLKDHPTIKWPNNFSQDYSSPPSAVRRDPEFGDN